MAIQGSTKRADGVYSTCRIEVIAVLAPRTVGPPDARRTRRAFWCLGYYPSSIGSLPWLHKTPLRALYRGGGRRRSTFVSSIGGLAAGTAVGSPPVPTYTPSFQHLTQRCHIREMAVDGGEAHGPPGPGRPPSLPA